MRMSDGRVVTAGDFQEALRDPKVAYRITTQMLASMAGDLAAWNLSGLTPQIGLNVTSADFQKGDLCQRIARALDKVQLSPEHLVVEITEQVFIGGAARRSRAPSRRCGSAASAFRSMISAPASRR